MALTKYRLGELLQLEDTRNSDGQYTLDDVKGISIQKVFIETKADMEGVSLAPYILVKPSFFAYVTVTSRNGEKITLSYNTTNDTYIVSSSYVVFSILRTDLLDPEYLFMYFKRPEFDRYARFNSWGSARETFSWEDMCDINIELPDISVQQKYVAIYKAMVANQKSYDCGLEDLKLVCDGYIEDLRRKMPCEKIGQYIKPKNARNVDKSNDCVVGLSTQKTFREAQSRVNRNDLGNYKIVQPYEFAFVPTTDTWKVLAFALNKSGHPVVVSPIYEVFAVDKATIVPEYLSIWLSRKEFDRYARFNSWGSARENFSFDEMCNVQIPIPDVKVQKAIAEIFDVYNERKAINERLRAQIKDLCPILVKGSLEEGRTEEVVS